MNILEQQYLRMQAIRLADLIARAGPAQMRFRSEQQFLAVVSLPGQSVAAPPGN